MKIGNHDEAMMRTSKASERCDCGEPLHYSRLQTKAYVELLIATVGPTQVVTTPDGSWWIPRHYVALHGIKAEEIPSLAEQYGWEKVDD